MLIGTIAIRGASDRFNRRAPGRTLCAIPGASVPVGTKDSHRADLMRICLTCPH